MNSPVEEIKSRLDVVDVVGSYIRLQKAGSNYKALCPFHREKTPSFNVSAPRQIWHCFGCGKGGDIFKFVMEIEGLDFPEALRTLAQKAGVELKREDPRIRSEKNRLHDVLDDAVSYFQKNLESVPAVRAYLKKRGLADATIADFKIGFSFDTWDGLLKHLRQKGYKDEEAEKAGLAIRSENGSWYDRFRSRIMFPISDSGGRVVGFGGRIFEAPGQRTGAPAGETTAKYINTPQTLIYDKSRMLYGFDKAKDAVRQKSTCVVVEGYMDAVMSHQAGVVNTVAVSGTALTPQQLQMIRRLADTIVSSFDRDAAGESATKRSLDMASEFGFERKAVLLPETMKDPADAVLADPEIWVRAVADAMPIVEFYFTRAFQHYSPETAEGVRSITAAVLPEFAIVANEVEKGHWVARLSRALSVSEDAIWRELQNVRRSETGSFAGGSVSDGEAIMEKTRREHLEELALGSLVLFRDLAPYYGELAASHFSTNPRKDLFSALVGADPALLVPELKEYGHQLALKTEVFLESVPDKKKEARGIFRELSIECLRHECDEFSRGIAEAERRGDDERATALAAQHHGAASKMHSLIALRSL